MMQNDLQENEPRQSEEERRAAAGIEALLSGKAQAALINAAKKQYMLYAPTMLIDEQPAPRLQQLWRVCLEFGLGFPRKFKGYWDQVFRNMLPSEPNVASAVIFLPLAPLLFVLSLPLALLSFFKAFAIALWNSVLTRTMVFLPMSEYVRRLQDSTSP